ncbi:protein mono-ADP-ribosyltransferase PARP4-like [Amphiura filiformis]|uniref:protein mono-ADP-ribosyltransferase PARP4-like n=1 Tax=Amphiura filiformis TaxID=82378 RepID=UPI003B2125BE
MKQKQVAGTAPGTATAAGIFHGCQIVLDLDAAQVRFKQKQELRKKITDNGGIVSYIITKKSSHLIVSNAEKAKDSYKGRMAQKYGVPILGMDFIDVCLSEDKLVDTEPHIVCGTSMTQEFSSGKIVTGPAHPQEKPKISKASSFNINKIRVYPLGSDQAPAYPDECYELAKCTLLQKTDPKTKECSFYLLELHVIPPLPPGGASIRDDVTHPFRVMVHHGKLSDIKSDTGGVRECRYSATSEEALQVYSFLYNQKTTSPWNMTKTKKMLSRWIGSPKYRKVMLERGMAQEPLTEEVASLVDHVWQEALGQLSDILTVPVETISIDKVEKAEAVLLQIKRSLDQSNTTQLKELSQEFYSLLPQKSQQDISTRSMIAKKQNLCQLVKDIVGVSEATNWSTRSSLDAKYRALRCHIESLPENHHEFNDIKNVVLSSQTENDAIEICHIYAVSRAVEETNFASDLDNKKMLFHASRPTNFVGILSRGLLLPKIVVDDFGGVRTDAGMLGSAIYFANSSSTSAKYSAASQTTGTRLMTINEVALGKCQDVNKYHKELSEAPQGYHSVHGVKGTELYPSDFKDDEFAVYDITQQRIRYLVEFTLPADKPKNLNVSMETAAILDQDDLDIEMVSGDKIDLNDVQSITDPLSKVQAGLLSNSDQPVPLKAVHVRAKLLDLAAEVVVFQVYTNENDDPIEAKYVFPLDDMAAVCGFEAFINDKHIVGEVKDKETAHKEYKEAISKGHGAYLMDEETPDVFTVSVGNLPPKTTVVIKIVYMAELSVDGDKIVFGLPGSVAPWKKDAALSEVTQTDLKTVKVDKEMKGNLSVEVAIEMPYDIRTLESPTHPIRIKRTASKATVALADGCTRLDDGFQLQIGLAEIHVPRMWVERHPSKKDSQACMLTFYPEFEANTEGRSEVIFMLDLSNSMRGESLREAKKIALLALHHLPDDWVFNIVVFGTAFDELFASSQPKNGINTKKAQTFINSLEASMGSTEAWHPLHAYFLLKAETLRNVYLISDGHINNEEATLNAVHDNAMYTRLFTFGVSSTANRHLLRALARVGAGAFQFFDSKVKSKWEGKIKSQLNKSSHPVLTSVSVEWQQFDNHAPRPIQAPNQITSLFSGSRQVVYGYVPFCTQATLKAMIAGKEVSTMVSTHDLSITEGKMLHQLTARAIIRDWEDGTLDVNRTEHEVKKTEQKNYIIGLSKEYSIVTKFTSFVAIETRDKDEDKKEKKGVDIEELLRKAEIDTLTYMGWEPTKSPPGQAQTLEVSPEETVEDLLQRAHKEETFSILTAQRYYEDALELTKEKVSYNNPVFYKAILDIVKFYYDVQGDTGKIDEQASYFRREIMEKGDIDDIDIEEIMENDVEFLEEVRTTGKRIIKEKRCSVINEIVKEFGGIAPADFDDDYEDVCLQPEEVEELGLVDLASVDTEFMSYEQSSFTKSDLASPQTSKKKKKKSASPTIPSPTPNSAGGAAAAVKEIEDEDYEESDYDSDDDMGFGLFDDDDDQPSPTRMIFKYIPPPSMSVTKSPALSAPQRFPPQMAQQASPPPPSPPTVSGLHKLEPYSSVPAFRSGGVPGGSCGPPPPPPAFGGAPPPPPPGAYSAPPPPPPGAYSAPPPPPPGAYSAPPPPPPAAYSAPPPPRPAVYSAPPPPPARRGAPPPPPSAPGALARTSRQRASAPIKAQAARPPAASGISLDRGSTQSVPSRKAFRSYAYASYRSYEEQSIPSENVTKKLGKPESTQGVPQPPVRRFTDSREDKEERLIERRVASFTDTRERCRDRPAARFPEDRDDYARTRSSKTKDTQEDQMDESIQEVANKVDNLCHMAMDMQSEISSQNQQIEGIFNEKVGFNVMGFGARGAGGFFGAQGAGGFGARGEAGLKEPRGSGKSGIGRRGWRDGRRPKRMMEPWSNIDKVLQRDEKLAELDDRADSLLCGSSQFETAARRSITKTKETDRPQYDTSAIHVTCLRQAGVTNMRQLLDMQEQDGSWKFSEQFLIICKIKVADFIKLIKDAGIELLGHESTTLVKCILVTVIVFLELEQHLSNLTAAHPKGVVIRTAVTKARKWVAEQQDLHPGLASRAYPGFTLQDWIEVGRLMQHRD